LPAKLSPSASFKSDRVTLEELAACADNGVIDNGIKNIMVAKIRLVMNCQYFMIFY
jgi:hypothetical protein